MEVRKEEAHLSDLTGQSGRERKLQREAVISRVGQAPERSRWVRKVEGEERFVEREGTICSSADCSRPGWGGT